MNDRVYAIINRALDILDRLITCVQTVLLKRVLCTTDKEVGDGMDTDDVGVDVSPPTVESEHPASN